MSYRKNYKRRRKKDRKLKIMYTKADQLLAKREDLVAIIAGDEPDIILITNVVPKAQIYPTEEPLLALGRYDVNKILTNLQLI